MSSRYTRDNTKTILVHLGRNSDQFAKINKEDLDQLIELGLSPTWNVFGGGYVCATAHRASGGYVGVARVLLDAGPGQRVKYIDGNKLNLKRENLQLTNKGWSTRRDRDFLTPKEKQKRKQSFDWEPVETLLDGALGALPEDQERLSSTPSGAPRGCSNAERDDQYRGVLFQVDDRWRVVVCRNGYQWILQQKEAKDHWEGRKYFSRKRRLAEAIRERFGEATYKRLATAIEGLPI